MRDNGSDRSFGIGKEHLGKEIGTCTAAKEIFKSQENMIKTPPIYNLPSSSSP